MGWFVSALNLLFAAVGAVLLVAVRQAPIPALGAAVVLAASISTLASIWSEASPLRTLSALAAIVFHLCVACLGVAILLEGISEQQQGDIVGGWTTWLSPGLFLAVPLLSMGFVGLAFVRSGRASRNGRAAS